MASRFSWQRLKVTGSIQDDRTERDHRTVAIWFLLARSVEQSSAMAGSMAGPVPQMATVAHTVDVGNAAITCRRHSPATRFKATMKRQPYTQKKLRLIRNRRTERGKATYDSHCANAYRASKAHQIYHRFSRQPPASSAVDRRLKRLLKLNRQLKIELHCRHMRAVHSAKAAARRAAKINGKAGL